MLVLVCCVEDSLDGELGALVQAVSARRTRVMVTILGVFMALVLSGGRIAFACTYFGMCKINRTTLAR